MKAGQNINGGGSSWTTATIRRVAMAGGGIAARQIGCEFSVVADNGDIVAWDEWGEVKTVIRAEDMNGHSDQPGRSASAS
jgi:hypothetical protein